MIWKYGQNLQVGMIVFLKANKELAIMSLNSKVKESYRLSGKLEGITLVYGYMQDIESSIE